MMLFVTLVRKSFMIGICTIFFICYATTENMDTDTHIKKPTYIQLKILSKLINPVAKHIKLTLLPPPLFYDTICGSPQLSPHIPLPLSASAEFRLHNDLHLKSIKSRLAEYLISCEDFHNSDIHMYVSVHDIVSHKELNNVLETMLKRRMPVDAIGPNNTANTALFRLCCHKEPNINGIALLLRFGANPNGLINPQTGHVRTPLIEALKNDHITVVKLLLEHKADPNIPEIDHRSITTALMYAVEKAHYNKAYDFVVRLLLYHGANPFIKNKAGDNAIDKAKYHKLDKLALLMTHARKHLISHLTFLLSGTKTDAKYFERYAAACIIAEQRYHYEPAS